MKKALFQVDMVSMIASIVWIALLRCSSSSADTNISTSMIQATIESSPKVPYNEDTRVGSQCFQVRGVPTLRLQCPLAGSGHEQLIRVRQVFYGVPATTTETGSGNSSCVYHENHCTQLADLPPGHQCNGRSHCSVHVSNPYLMNCRQYAVYMQINYTCVPKVASLDICSTTNVEVGQGYVRSPSYPDVPIKYPIRRQLCQCQLRAADGDNRKLASTIITIRIVDLALTTPEIFVSSQDGEKSNGSDVEVNDPCQSNYLHITGLDRRCPGQAIVDTPETTDVDISGDEKVIIEYRSDAGRYQLDRGFWIDFAGSEGSNVKVTCETLWSEEVAEIGGPPNKLGPKPVTSAPPSVDRKIIATTTTTSIRRMTSQVETSGGHSANSDDYFTSWIDRRRSDDVRANENEFRLHDVEVLSAQPWLPWPDEDESEPETNSTVLVSRSTSSLNRVAEDRRQLSSWNEEHRSTGDAKNSAADERILDSITSGQPLWHRVKEHLVEHRVPDNYSHDRWSTVDEMKRSAAALFAHGSEIFENHDLRRAQESLKFNVDEVQIITGIVIGILILVAICIVIVLVFRRK